MLVKKFHIYSLISYFPTALASRICSPFYRLRIRIGYWKEFSFLLKANHCFNGTISMSNTVSWFLGQCFFYFFVHNKDVREYRCLYGSKKHLQIWCLEDTEIVASTVLMELRRRSCREVKQKKPTDE